MLARTVLIGTPKPRAIEAVLADQVGERLRAVLAVEGLVLRHVRQSSGRAPSPRSKTPSPATRFAAPARMTAAPPGALLTAASFRT